MTEQEAGGRGVIKCHCCQRPVSFDTGSPSHLDGSPLCSQGRALSDGLRGMSMAEHLPECPVEKMLRSGRTVGSQSCICEHLRACEERVEESIDRAWQQAAQLAVAHARTATLDAAREAVEVLTAWPEGIESDDLSFLNYLHGVRDALTAIDALRENL